MERLQRQLNELMNRLPRPDDLRRAVEGLVSVYPFNEFEYIISHLLAAGRLTLDEYLEMRGHCSTIT